jgi:tetratricopeptide (TPR) repeat protein
MDRTGEDFLLGTKVINKSELDYDVKKDDLVLVDDQYWMVVDDKVGLYKEKGIRLSDEIPNARFKELESKWEKEIPTDERKWVERGISIYSILVELEPNNEAYKYNFGRMLFKGAIYNKRNQATRKKAKELFKEVIELNPNHLYAHLCEYQLGFLFLYEKEWLNGIHHFISAINSDKLDYFQQLRAYCNLGICYSQVGEIERAKVCISKARKIDSVENRFTPEIEMASLQIETAVSQYKPYTLIMKESEQQITEEDAEEIADDYEEGRFVVLDWRNHKAVFRGPKDTVQLSPRSAELLKFFMTNKQSFSSKELWEKLYRDDLGQSTVGERSVKTMILNLRKGIRPCFDENPKEIVLLTDKKYHWNRNYPYKIIVPNQKR